MAAHGVPRGCICTPSLSLCRAARGAVGHKSFNRAANCRIQGTRNQNQARPHDPGLSRNDLSPVKATSGDRVGTEKPNEINVSPLSPVSPLKKALPRYSKPGRCPENCPAAPVELVLSAVGNPQCGSRLPRLCTGAAGLLTPPHKGTSRAFPYAGHFRPVKVLAARLSIRSIGCQPEPLRFIFESR
jgi:hypothetical protein